MYVVIDNEELAIDTPDGVQIALAQMDVHGIAAALVWDRNAKLELVAVGYLQRDGRVTEDPAPTAATPSIEHEHAKKVPPGQAKKGGGT